MNYVVCIRCRFSKLKKILAIALPFVIVFKIVLYRVHTSTYKAKVLFTNDAMQNWDKKIHWLSSSYQGNQDSRLGKAAYEYSESGVVKLLGFFVDLRGH